MTPPSIARRLLGAFLSVYPTITVVGWVLMPLMEGWPWPLRTLVLVAVLVPIVVLVSGPAADALLSRLRRGLPDDARRPQPKTDPY